MATLNVSSILQQGNSLVSSNGAFFFKLTEQGNLIVVDDIEHVHWTSKTSNCGTPPYKLILEEDRNLILLDGKGSPTWSSNTWSPIHDPEAKLSILNSRDVVLTGVVDKETQVLWSTNTAIPVKSTLYMDDNLYPGNVLLSPNLKYSLRMQNDGNIVLYDENSTPYWSSNTRRTNSVYRLLLQSDNNFVAYDTQGPIWASDTCTSTPVSDLKVVLQNDKNLVMYANNKKIWSVP